MHDTLFTETQYLVKFSHHQSCMELLRVAVKHLCIYGNHTGVVATPGVPYQQKRHRLEQEQDGNLARGGRRVPARTNALFFLVDSHR